MRLVHCTNVHAWNDVRIFVKMASSCARDGHETHLVALDHGVSKTFQESGVTIHLLSSADLKGRFARASKGARRVIKYVESLSPDVIHFHDPELLPHVALLKSRARKIYDVHEDLPRQISTKGWIPGVVRPAAAYATELAENIGVRFMDNIVAATPTIAARFPPTKTATVRNFPIPKELNSDAAMPYKDREPIITYVGGISVERGLREMMSAAQLSAPNLQIALAGPLPKSLIDEVFYHEPSVIYCGSLDRAGVSALLGRSRAGLCVLHPTKNYPDALPVKLFEYMAAGLPVIASDFPLWREIVGDCGICVDPLNAGAIASAMSWILKNPAEAEAMGRRGSAAVASRYNWRSEASALASVYSSAASRASKPAATI